MWLSCTAMIRRNYWHTKQSEWISKTMWTERRQIEGHLEKRESTILCDSGKILLAEVVGRQGLKTKGHNGALRVRKMFYILFRVGVAWLFTLVKTPLNHTPKKIHFALCQLHFSNLFLKYFSQRCWPMPMENHKCTGPISAVNPLLVTWISSHTAP